MRALFYFTITAIFWGLNFHLAKVLLQEVSFLEAGFWRYLFGVIPLFFLSIKGLPTREDIFRNIKGISLVGLVGLFGFNFFFFWGLMHSSAINGALIIAITPAMTLLASRVILKTPLVRNQIAGVMLSLTGVLYLILKGDLSSFSNVQFQSGDLLLLLSSMLFAIQNVWVKKYSHSMSNISFTFLTNLFCLLGFVATLPFVGMIDFTGYSNLFWCAAIGIGVFGTSVAYYLWNAGIQLSSANQAGIFINVVPLSAALFSVAFGEALFGYHLWSGLIILLGVFVIRR